MVFRSGQIERNELFLPGRMAYVVDLDDEFTDTDIPTTLIRSKADCPSMEVPARPGPEPPLTEPPADRRRFPFLRLSGSDDADDQ